MDPNQTINPPIVPQEPVPTAPQPQPQPQDFPGQATPQPVMQPPIQQQPYAQPVYTGAPQQPMPGQSNNSYPGPGNSKKKLLFILVPVIIIVIAAVAILFSGGAKQLVNKATGIELENYTSTSFGFSIQTPKGWTPEEQNEEFTKDVSWQEPVGDLKDKSEASKHYASIRVKYELADKDYLEKGEQEYFDDIKKGIQRVTTEDTTKKATTDYIPEVGAVESEEMTTVSGLKAYKVKLKITNFNGEKDQVGYEYGLFVYVDKKNQYELTLRAHESESINSKADGILTSFAKK